MSHQRQRQEEPLDFPSPTRPHTPPHPAPTKSSRDLTLTSSAHQRVFVPSDSALPLRCTSSICLPAPYRIRHTVHTVRPAVWLSVSQGYCRATSEFRIRRLKSQRCEGDTREGVNVPEYAVQSKNTTSPLQCPGLNPAKKATFY